jgi:hypothetical protein
MTSVDIRKRTWTWQGERGSAWQLNWRHEGKRHQKQFRTRQEAELYRDKLIRDRSARDYDVPRETRTADRWRVGRTEPSIILSPA